MGESQQLVFGLRFVRRIFGETLTYRNPNQYSATLWRIFSSNKSAPANRKKRILLYTNRNPNKQEVGFIFVWSGSELWCLFKYSRSKFKNKMRLLQPIQPVIPTSRRIRCIFIWSGSELWSLFKNSRSKLKKSKTYSSWCPFPGLSDGTTLMLIQSGRMVSLSMHTFFTLFDLLKHIHLVSVWL